MGFLSFMGGKGANLRISNLKSQISNLKSKIENRKSKIENSESVGLVVVVPAGAGRWGDVEEVALAHPLGVAVAEEGFGAAGVALARGAVGVVGLGGDPLVPVAIGEGVGDLDHVVRGDDLVVADFV